MVDNPRQHEKLKRDLYNLCLTNSYRHYPVNLDVISWLGVWYVKSELYEKAIHYFETAAQIQPTEVRRCALRSILSSIGGHEAILRCTVAAKIEFASI